VGSKSRVREFGGDLRLRAAGADRILGVTGHREDPLPSSVVQVSDVSPGNAVGLREGLLAK
jgi:hypothetical protein